MSRYKLWIKLHATETAYTYLFAENDYAAIQLGEAQFGRGSVLGWWKES